MGTLSGLNLYGSCLISDIFLSRISAVLASFFTTFCIFSSADFLEKSPYILLLHSEMLGKIFYLNKWLILQPLQLFNIFRPYFFLPKVVYFCIHLFYFFSECIHCVIYLL